MSNSMPRKVLRTHKVTNVPGLPEDANLYTEDAILRQHVLASGGRDHEVHLSNFGAKLGTRENYHEGLTANRNPPQFKPFDQFGQRIDEVEFHPSYHHLMDLGISHGIASRAWTHPEGGHVAHCALMFMMSQVESGVTCPMSMSSAAVPAIKQQAELARLWEPLLLSAKYDRHLIPVEHKNGATLGMAMTEKQGGSDVRANTTQANRVSNEEYCLVGHKWFCSAPMSDGFLTLAQHENALGCYLVPRWRPDGTRNSIEIQRLKDKLGDRANASAEIEYHEAYAIPVGAPDRGIATIIEMVNHTRLGCVVGATSLMRQSLSWATFHTQNRSAFGRPLIEQPLMRRVIADMTLEIEGHVALLFLLAETADQSTHDQQAATLTRCITPIAKYWSTKRCPVLVVEAMECLGGAGFIEEHVMPRIYRQAPLNGIWEGSGNVIALDAVRAFAKDPACVNAMCALLAMFQGKQTEFNSYAEGLIKVLKGQEMTPSNSRHYVESLAKALTVCALYHRQLPDLAETYIKTHIVSPHTTFGAHTVALDEASLIERASVFRI